MEGREAIREQFSRSARQAVCCGAFWRPIGPPCPSLWPGYPYLYRILSSKKGKHQVDEGTGLLGISSRSMHFNKERPIPKQSLVVDHVKTNIRITPWISASFNLSTQESYIRKKFRLRLWSPETEVFMAKIDVRYLGPDASIVNLSYEPILDEVLLNEERAKQLANNWDEVLIFWYVPQRAIVSSRLYWYNPHVDIIEWSETPNPSYAYGTHPECPCLENFSRA